VPGTTDAPRRTLRFADLDDVARRRALECEWLVTNGLGGYAAGTVGGLPTRRYHGLLIAALPAPLGRRLLLAELDEHVRIGGEDVALHGEELLQEFALEQGLPYWRYAIDGTIVEKRVVMPHDQNTVHAIYLVESAERAVQLKVWLAAHNRSHDDPVDQLPGEPVVEHMAGRYEIAIANTDLPRLKLAVHGCPAAFTSERRALPERSYQVETARGYAMRAAPWTPGFLELELEPGKAASLIASTETWEIAAALGPEDAMLAERTRRRRCLTAAVPAARDGLAAELVLAADQFIARPVGRSADRARLHAEGDDDRTIIAGYHWFTDWGRDTMISLEGLTLVTGRHADAEHILQTFAHSIRDGLLPNLFPEGEREGLYHTADATLWLFHAIERYAAVTGNRGLIAALLPRLVEVAEKHLAGTRFGIGVDPADGLLRAAADGYQLTWMDAKVDDWVVTPRRGKPVEINALWYNALCALSGWLDEAGEHDAAARFAADAARARESFNRRFPRTDMAGLYDVVDGPQGDDAAFRPNQLLAIALPHAVLEERHWRPVLAAVRAKLLTPYGLRTLSRDHRDYRAQYFGDIYSRDAAYHQGTVWPWLIGPFIDAWLKTFPDDVATAVQCLAAFDAHLSDDCIGSISEIFDAEQPYTPRGCVAQAWSVAEVLRSLVKVQAAAERALREGQASQSSATTTPSSPRSVTRPSMSSPSRST
jgi:predicted glycogen debranching enzyme